MEKEVIRWELTKEAEALYENGIPSFKTEGSAGMDLRTLRRFTLNPGKRTLVKLGIRTVFSKKISCLITPRSGLALKQGITVLNSPGTIDSDYRDEWGVVLINLGEDPVIFDVGDRVCQVRVVNIPDVDNIKSNIDDDENTERKGGFGHTGLK